MASRESDISPLEGTGALNFLSLDDLTTGEEGEIVDPESIIQLETPFDLPRFPEFERNPDDSFLMQIQRSGKNRVLLQLPGIKNPERIKELLGKTAKLTFHLVDDDNSDSLNANVAPFGKIIVSDYYDNKIKYLIDKKIDLFSSKVNQNLNGI